MKSEGSLSHYLNNEGDQPDLIIVLMMEIVRIFETSVYM
jgi:hypothetical protein